MKENFKACLKAVLRYEGGYVNHPSDPGGATNYGVTFRVYDAWRRKHGLAPRSVKLIEMSEVEAIYKRDYWDRIKGDDLPSGVDLAVFDLAVNSGVSRAAKMLQACVGVPQDGLIGPATLAAVRSHHNCHVALCSRRLAFLQRLSTWPTFGRGWGSRVADVKKKCCNLADNPPAPEHREPEPVVEENYAYPENFNELAEVPDEIPTYTPRAVEHEYHEDYHDDYHHEEHHHEEHHPHHPHQAKPGVQNLKGGLIAAATATAGALQQSDFVSISDNGWTGLAMVGASIAFAIWQAVIPAINGDTGE
jgi:lysozyme family protein